LAHAIGSENRPAWEGPLSRKTEHDRTFRDEALPWLDAVYRYALRLSADPDAASDLTQETFLRAYRSWSSYETGTSVRSWLFAICRNVFLRGEERRKTHRKAMVVLREPDPRGVSHETLVLMSGDACDPEGAFWRSQLDTEVLRALEELPPEYSEAVTLADIEGFKLAEIAEILGVPLGTIKSRVFRARRILQKKLYDYAVESGIIRPRRAPPE